MAVKQLRPTHILYQCAKCGDDRASFNVTWDGVRRLTCNNSMAYLKNWSDNFFQMFFMETSWVAVSINNIKTRASREMTSRKNIKMFYFNGSERCQTLACGGARYLPSLIALLALS